MEVEQQVPMLPLGNESSKSNECMGTGSSAEQTATHVGCNGSSVCIHPGYVPKTRHQSSVDSGLGSTLDPISECHEYCSMADQTNVAEDPDQGQQRKISSPEKLQDAAKFSVKTGVSCSWGYSLYEEAHVLPTGVTPRDAVPNACIQECGQNCRTEIQNAALQRHKSEPIETVAFHIYDEPSNNGNDGDTQILRSQFNSFSSEESSLKDQKTRRKLRPLVTSILFCLIGMAVVGALAFGLFSFFRSEETEEVKRKIVQLEKVIGQMKNSTPSFPEMTSPKTDGSRPTMHLGLKSRNIISENSWKGKTLQWIPQIAGNVGLQYNDETGALVVKESGSYFVYDQIFVYRHLRPSSEGMDRIANHTIFHAIYKRPFNFPANRKPPIVAESALSNCWNANSNTQLSSYQGMIVQVRKFDQLFVVLQDYDESIDTLNPTSTFFGIFKL